MNTTVTSMIESSGRQADGISAALASAGGVAGVLVAAGSATDTARHQHLLIVEIVEFAEAKHAGQKRKNGDPYVGHLHRVAALAGRIASEMGLVVSDVLSATAVGLLHDAIEDAECDFEDIVAVAGTAVATAVAWLSDDKRLPSPSRHAAYLWQLSMAPVLARIVKLADISDNASDSVGLLDSSPGYVTNWATKAIATVTAIGRDDLCSTLAYRRCLSELDTLFRSAQAAQSGRRASIESPVAAVEQA